jgi:hypothetical protein
VREIIIANKYTMTKSLITIASSLILMACAAPSAPDYSGGWVPVNQFESEIKTIPKTRPYVYGAIKLDTTLSTMLARWASDSKVAYTNTCDSDYTLPNAIADLKAQTMDAAIKQINDLYLKQGVTVSFTRLGKLNLSCNPTR